MGARQTACEMIGRKKERKGEIMKITELAPEHIARFDEWAEKWVQIGLSTEPADFDRAIEAALTYSSAIPFC